MIMFRIPRRDRMSTFDIMKEKQAAMRCLLPVHLQKDTLSLPSNTDGFRP